MNLKTLKRQAKKTFNQLERMGFVLKVTYKRSLGVTNDYTNGEDIVSYEEHKIRMHLTSFSRTELTNQILSSDVKAIVPKEEISFTPQIDDIVVVEDVEYSVIDFMNTPSESTIEFHLRGGA